MNDFTPDPRDAHKEKWKRWMSDRQNEKEFESKSTSSGHCNLIALGLKDHVQNAGAGTTEHSIILRI
jgi:hypothetical protein